MAKESIILELNVETDWDGSSPTTLTHLGMAWLAAGNEEKARRAFGQARDLEPRVGALEALLRRLLGLYRRYRSVDALVAELRESAGAERASGWDAYLVAQAERELQPPGAALAPARLLEGGARRHVDIGVEREGDDEDGATHGADVGDPAFSGSLPSHQPAHGALEGAGIGEVVNIGEGGDVARHRQWQDG